MSQSSFSELRVWQEAMKLTKSIYERTAGFPKHELYGLSQQMRRAVPFRCQAILQRAKAIAQIKISFVSCCMRGVHFSNCRPNY